MIVDHFPEQGFLKSDTVAPHQRKEMTENCHSHNALGDGNRKYNVAMESAVGYTFISS